MQRLKPRMPLAAWVIPILALVVLSGCGGDGIVNPTDPAYVIVTASGNNQSALFYNQLPAPLTVSVSTFAGTLAPNVKVDWKVTAGGGQLATDNFGLAATTSTFTDTQGRASVNWILGPTAGTQSVSASVTDGVAVFSATAAAPVLALRYDGTTWSTSLKDNHGARASLESVWGSSASDVFAGGGGCQGPFTVHYDGSSWADTPTCTGGSLFKIIRIWGSSATDAFALVRNALPPSLSTDVAHYDGQSWAIVYTYRPGNFLGLNGIWSRSANDAFAVGDRGVILHFDGSNWNTQSTGTTQNLRAVWGVGTGTSVFAVGDGGTILYYDGTTWRPQSSGTAQALTAISGASATDIFAVGGGGTILHYNGTTWTSQASGTTQGLTGVWEGSSSAAFAVGGASTILRYDGTRWTAQPSPVPMNFRGVWGSSPSNVFVVGDPR